MRKKNLHLDSPTQSIGFQLWKAANEWQSLLKSKLAPLDLSPSELILLASLYKLIVARGEATQEHIAKDAKVGKMTVSKILRALEKKRIINRKEHEVDTRAKSITITNAGIHTLKQALQLVARHDDKFFACVSGKVNVLTDLLNALNDD
jgi:DNA-binding MarR family transcriptional regulator